MRESERERVRETEGESERDDITQKSASFHMA